MDDNAALWLVACAGLSGIGVLLSILVWRRRGAASGLRLVSWALLPIGLWLVGLLPIVVRFGAQLFEWVTTSVFKLQAWVGFGVIGLAVVIWILSGVLLGRRRAAVEDSDDGKPVESARSTPGKQIEPSKAKPAADDDMSDIEAILKRRGIE